MNKCRACENKFFKNPLLTYSNMPKAAQYMPDAGTLALDESIELEVMQCSGCGLVQLSNEPVDYYKEVIRATSVSKEMYTFRQKQFSKLVKDFSLEGKKVIEIACGKGEYLQIMAERPVVTFGIEYSSDAVSICRVNGLNVSENFIDSSEQIINNGPFDAFFILNYLEHLPNPNELLKGIYNNLSNEGVGLVEVPNFNMILEENLFSEFISDHLMYFTKETLTFLLNRNGFEVLECSEVWDRYILSAIVKKKKPLDISQFNEIQKSLVNEVNGYVESFSPDKVALWGAGHQALTVMALAELKDKVKYVIDSAKFKQGKYTQATHIPIVDPGVLNSDSLDAILIMAAGYSDEIANQILKSNSTVKIAILRKAKVEVVR